MSYLRTHATVSLAVFGQQLFLTFFQLLTRWAIRDALAGKPDSIHRNPRIDVTPDQRTVSFCELEEFRSSIRLGWSLFTFARIVQPLRERCLPVFEPCVFAAVPSSELL
jgi:hypothetical protein